MPYTLKTHRPTCQYCAKPLKPSTQSHYRGLTDDASTFTGEFRSKAEVQKATNKRVMSVSRDEKTGIVWRFSTWDGETYRDDMFCTERCGYFMGRFAVRAGMKMANREKRREPL